MPVLRNAMVASTQKLCMFWKHVTQSLLKGSLKRKGFSEAFYVYKEFKKLYLSSKRTLIPPSPFNVFMSGSCHHIKMIIEDYHVLHILLCVFVNLLKHSIKFVSIWNHKHKYYFCFRIVVWFVIHQNIFGDYFPMKCSYTGNKGIKVCVPSSLQINTWKLTAVKQCRSCALTMVTDV